MLQNGQNARRQGNSVLQRYHSRVLLLSQLSLWFEHATGDEESVLSLGVKTPQGTVRPSTEWRVREMEPYVFDDCHFTDRGSETVAAALVTPVLTGMPVAHPARP
jgi:hypothetical protein